MATTGSTTVDYQELLNTANGIQNALDDMGRAFQRIIDLATQDLAQYWNSKSQQDFSNKASNELMKKLQDCLNVIGEYIEFLQKTAANYQQAEADAQAAVTGVQVL